eukprot:TRINITY_DN3503_c0_g1_i1.p1 TRINITY_DN3503_c0_g1~~TRINITY_DN3503_c0_g1_i1.p1  ORF type:complete len:441 (-),score=123.82 TRINITY_DN3503_c0_g1_i1:441-1763(-)
MVQRRVLQAEESFKGSLRDLKASSWGYFIGSESGDYLAFLAKTPELPEGESTNALSWSVEHAKQILPLLPGGLSIKGVYYASDSSSAEPEAYPRAHQTLQAILPLLKAQTELYYLEVDTKDPELAKLYSVEVSLSKVAARNSSKKFAELQYSSHIPWIRAKGHFVLDFNSLRTAHGVDESADFTKHMKSLLDQLEEVLNSKALITFNHEFKVEDEAIHTSLGDQNDNEGHVLDTQILLESDALNGDGNEEDSSQKTASKLKLGGKVSICAFLRPGATIREACEAVITDILRSLRARFQIHGDTLEVDDKNASSEEEGPVIHEPPRRVLVPVPCTNNILISDYLFSGETTYDSTVSVKELFGFTPIPDEIDDELELIISPSEIQRVKDDEEEIVNSGIGVHSGGPPGIGALHKHSRKLPLYYAMALGILLLSAVIYYFKQN